MKMRMMKKIKKIYGMLTPIEPTSERYNNEVVWKFKCDCGNIVYRSLSHVKRNTRLGYVCSCGQHPTRNKSEKSRRIAKSITSNGGNKYLLEKESAYSNNKLGVKGVSYDKGRNKYVAQITYKKKNYYIGRYDTIEEAKIAYDKKRAELLEEMTK
jgi:AP2 domain